MTPRYGRPPDPAQRYVTRAGIYAMLPRDGQLLLTGQNLPSPDIQLPGGGIDPGEQPLAALHREVLEETGWSIRGARRFAAYRRFTYMPEYDLWAEKLCSIYIAYPVIERSAPSEPGHEALFLPYQQAAECLGSEGDRAMLWQALRLRYLR